MSPVSTRLGLSRIKLNSNHILKKSRQGIRLARLGANLLGGGILIQSYYQFPGISKIRQKQLTDYKSFLMWVDDLSQSMNVELHTYGEQMSESGLLVSNHISWLDTIVLTKARALGFVARHDLAEWPFLGTFTQRMGSVFINRNNKFQAYRSIPALEERLNQGRSVHIFPESTTSVGASVLAFFPMFYEAAVRTGKPVQPVAIRYTDGSGNLLKEPAYINNDTFFDTLGRILLVDRVHTHLHFLTPIDSRNHDRKALARLSRQMIRDSLVQHA